MTTHDIELKGCAPVPLAHYLKALGILRLVAEQADPQAKGYWRGDTFVLRSKLDKTALHAFFLQSYQPTPVLAPWNGGSGFYYQEEKLKKKDPTTGKKIKTGARNQPSAATKIVDSLVASSGQRFENYRLNIEIVKDMLKNLGYQKAPDVESKDGFIQAVRNKLPDDAIRWIDAAVVLTSEKAKYPPLLGTGGNDGNTDFTSNFMQRLCDVFNLDGTSTKSARMWVEGALFSIPLDGLLKGAAIGQFFPGAVGGPNSTTGFNSDSVVNPWDFILMIEGALFFAAASVKRLEHTKPGVLSYPFSVRASGVGYGSASPSEEESSRAEMWVPLWAKPTGVKELEMLMSEGRAQVGTRLTRNGVDFARAVSTLGVDRGISAFQRYGFHVRYGKTYFATPLDRFQVQRQPQVELLSDVDEWLETFRRKASSDKAPASVGRALRRLEEAILNLCKVRSAGRMQDVLIALGECEHVLAKSSKWAKETAFVRPIPALSPAWLKESDDGSPEFRLAASLGSVYGIRSNMESTHSWTADGQLMVGWNKGSSRDVVWFDGDTIHAMNAVMSRRIINAVKPGADIYPDRGRINADLGDIADFIEGRVDVQRVADLLWGLILVDWPAVKGYPLKRRDYNDSLFPGAAYGLLKLCFPGGKVQDIEIPIVPEIHRKASVGDGVAATQLAIRRLRGSGLSAAVTAFDVSCEQMEHIAAALLFPLKGMQLETIANKVLRRMEKKED